MLNAQHSQQHHDMQLVETHEDGSEEWYCPLCGRRFILQWPPDYEKVIIEVGDEYAIHSGGKGGLQMKPPQVNPQAGSEAEEPVFSPELRAALEEVLDGIDFSDWPD